MTNKPTYEELEQKVRDLEQATNRHKHTEEEKEILQSQLRQAQKMEAIATLAGGIAHQFNNALSPITINLDMLEMDFPNDANITRQIEQMRSSAQRMAQLTNQLLAYARGGKYKSKVISLAEFVRNTIPLIEHTIKLHDHILTDLPQDITSVKIDGTQMQMVLSAILTNASEAIEGRGHIRIICRNEKITQDSFIGFPGPRIGNYASIIIKDDGEGMDEGTKSQIFEPFFTTKFQGRGLGMAAAYGIVKNHDGWIFVDSELGKGTKVCIYLPAIEDQLKEPKKLKIEPQKGTGTILIIEDEEMVMDVSSEILERLGYHVLEARTGREAITIAKTFEGNIDLAILDIVLPDMSGADTHLLLMEAQPNLKVIVCSGYSIDGPAQEIMDAGAQGFIQKPISIEDFSIAIREVLDKA